jgi:hypothetical protein
MNNSVRFFKIYTALKLIFLLYTVCPQAHTHFGWWVGFWCGWVKLNVLQKLWLVCRLAALLILRSVGILFNVFCRFMLALSVVLRLPLIPQAGVSFLLNQTYTFER